MTAVQRASSALEPAINSSMADLARRVRVLVLEESRRANVGHIGSALSIADLLAALYGEVLAGNQADDADRDRFILSKGHAALALYSVLHLSGTLTREQLRSYCGDGSLLGVHPDRDLAGVDFTTGSLGHGLSMGAGAALAGRMLESRRRVFVLMSDAECNEGSVWEAVMFAAHHSLSNLIAIVDANGQQALGYTKDVLDLNPLAHRWRAFGWEARRVDGHDPDDLAKQIASLDVLAGPPHVLIAETVFGKGVSFMEHQIRWHYLPMSDDEYHQALGEVDDR